MATRDVSPRSFPICTDLFFLPFFPWRTTFHLTEPKTLSKGFAQMVVGVLADPGVRQQIGQASRKLVERNYRWDDRLTQYSQLVTQVVQAQERP